MAKGGESERCFAESETKNATRHAVAYFFLFFYQVQAKPLPCAPSYFFRGTCGLLRLRVGFRQLACLYVQLVAVTQLCSAPLAAGSAAFSRGSTTSLSLAGCTPVAGT